MEPTLKHFFLLIFIKTLEKLKKILNFKTFEFVIELLKKIIKKSP